MSYLGATTNGEAAKRHFADVLYIAISAVTGLTIASAKSILGSKRSHSVVSFCRPVPCEVTHAFIAYSRTVREGKIALDSQPYFSSSHFLFRS